MGFSVKALTKPLFRVLRSRYTLLFVNGFLLATIIYFYIEDNYEKRLFEAMASYVKEKTADHRFQEDSVLIQSLHLTYFLGKSRSVVFNNKEIHSVISSLIHPVTFDLMTTNGACGSYSYILSRLLNELHIPNRIAQMKVNDLYGGHILVEAKTAKGWVALDASYDLFFKKAEGQMASFADVQGNWEKYRAQVPENYDTNYRYDGVRYANWEKIPVLMPLLKKVSYQILGKERTEGLSFRTLVLRKFKMLFQATVALYILMLGLVIRNYVKYRRQNNLFLLPSFFSNKSKQHSDAKEIRKLA